jgi:hypothetical protein
VSERTPRQTLGKIFISHAHEDKAFVHRLSGALHERGYSIWLDEREMAPGDDLPKTISEAIAKARVLLVVISHAAANSKWLRFELSLASDLMIKGKLRLIPVLIGDQQVPPELKSLLYADFRHDFDAGLAAVLRALDTEHERRLRASRKRRQRSKAWWQVIDDLMGEIWGGTGVMDFSGEFESRSIDFVSLSVPLDDDRQPVGTLDNWRRPPPLGHLFFELTCAYQTESAYGDPARPLTAAWLGEFKEFVEKMGYPAPAVLVITERPIGFDTEVTADPRISRSGATWFADLSGPVKRKEMREILRRAQELIVQEELRRELLRETLVWEQLDEDLRARRRFHMHGNFGAAQLAVPSAAPSTAVVRRVLRLDRSGHVESTTTGEGSSSGAEVQGGHDHLGRA